MAAHEPYDAGDVASVHDARSCGHVGFCGQRPDFGKDAFGVVGEEIWSSWSVGGKGDGTEVLVRCTVGVRREVRSPGSNVNLKH